MTPEFRQDVVTGHWVLISPERARRPGAPGVQPAGEKFYQPKEACPFEDPQKTGHGQPLLVYHNGTRVEAGKDFSGPWSTQVVRNKYPAVKDGTCGEARAVGPFSVWDAQGVHEVVITRDHDRDLHQLTVGEIAEILSVYRDRYRDIAETECSKYISIFHNHGRTAGGSLYHPHSQIISTPVLPSEVLESLRGAERYYQEHGRKVHEVLMEWEVAQGKRIVYENEKFIVFCPFASKTPYELRIFPKLPSEHFEEIADIDVPYLADALSVVFRKVHKALGNPDFNFFIHTAPVALAGQADDQESGHKYYHWHIEIVLRLAVMAGFELGTSIYINPVDPDQAAEVLRGTEV